MHSRARSDAIAKDRERGREKEKERKGDRPTDRLLVVMYYWHYRTLCPWNLLEALATYEYAASRVRSCAMRIHALNISRIGVKNNKIPRE